MTATVLATWAIAALATAGVILRPWRRPEWIWALGGAGVLVAAGLVSPARALRAVGEGGDVYLFLVGMMLLSEVAREHGLFDWVATGAVRAAGGAPARLLALVYAAGVAVTTFLSNDATAVVLTPAVFAVARKARADPLPLLLACALVANAASFVLPISNPANLVLYGGHMPPLGPWIAAFALPSLVAIIVTWLVLRIATRRRLSGNCEATVAHAPLGRGGWLALGGLVLTALLLLATSALDRPLGLPTALAGGATALAVSLATRRSPLVAARAVAWGVLPLVAGLFVLVEAMSATGVTGQLASALRGLSHDPVPGAAWAGTVLALTCNLMNNLPAGLLAAHAVAEAAPPRIITDALLIGVDLGPNLSVTGSLATILWLQAIRREGEDIGAWAFLKIGAMAMPLALAAALAARLLAS